MTAATSRAGGRAAPANVRRPRFWRFDWGGRYVVRCSADASHDRAFDVRDGAIVHPACEACSAFADVASSIHPHMRESVGATVTTREYPDGTSHKVGAVLQHDSADGSAWLAGICSIDDTGTALQIKRAGDRLSADELVKLAHALIATAKRMRGR